MKVVSICKGGRRYDVVVPIAKGEPIASDSPAIKVGVIVESKGHKGKVLETEGDIATVSWEDATISKVPIADLAFAGAVEKTHKEQQLSKLQEMRDMVKGGPGSGRRPTGDMSGGEKFSDKDKKQLLSIPKQFRNKYRQAREAGATHREAFLVAKKPREYGYGNI